MTREERIQLIKHLKYSHSIGADYMITDKDVDEIIKSLRQEPKTGHWIIEKWNNKEHYSCSSCQHVVDYEPCYHYCPYCGAKMVESQESEDK